MSRRAKLLGLVALVATGVTIAVPAQAASPIKTDVSLDGSAEIGADTYTVYGTVSSDNHNCVAGRTVRVYAKIEGTLFLRDIDRTGKSGRYAGSGEFKPGDLVVAKVAKRKIGPPGHRRTCGSASIAAA